MLRTGLYAVPALVGAAIVVGAGVCILIRLAGLHFDLNLPQARSHSDREIAEEGHPPKDRDA